MDRSDQNVVFVNILNGINTLMSGTLGTEAVLCKVPPLIKAGLPALIRGTYCVRYQCIYLSAHEQLLRVSHLALTWRTWLAAGVPERPSATQAPYAGPPQAGGHLPPPARHHHLGPLPQLPEWLQGRGLYASRRLRMCSSDVWHSQNRSSLSSYPGRSPMLCLSHSSSQQEPIIAICNRLGAAYAHHSGR